MELGFLGGAAGNLGAAETELLAWWRAYTTVLGTLLSVVLAVVRFRANIVAFVIRPAEPEIEGRKSATD